MGMSQSNPDPERTNWVCLLNRLCHEDSAALPSLADPMELKKNSEAKDYRSVQFSRSQPCLPSWSFGKLPSSICILLLEHNLWKKVSFYHFLYLPSFLCPLNGSVICTFMNKNWTTKICCNYVNISEYVLHIMMHIVAHFSYVRYGTKVKAEQDVWKKKIH